MAPSRHRSCRPGIQRLSRERLGCAGPVELFSAHHDDGLRRHDSRSHSHEHLHRATRAEKHGARAELAVRSAGKHTGSAIPDDSTPATRGWRRRSAAWLGHRHVHVQPQRRERRRSRRRRRVRDRREVGSLELARQRIGRSLRPATHRCVQAGWHASVAHRSRPQHPRRRALHAIHGVRPRWRRARRSRVQDCGWNRRWTWHRHRRRDEGLSFAHRADRWHPGAGHERRTPRQDSRRPRVLHGVRWLGSDTATPCT